MSKLEVKKFKPIKSNIVILVKEQEERLASGLYMPEVRHKDKFRQGVIIATGPEVKEVEVGESCIFNEYSGTKNIFDDDEEKRFYLFMKEEDVWATFAGEMEVVEITDTCIKNDG